MRPKTMKIAVITLVLALAALCVIPAPNYAAENMIELPGIMTYGQYGDSCLCPALPYFECGCRFEPIQ
jgi:hypothetical protein